MADLECFPDSKNSGRELVLSSFVKMVRMNEAKGNLKESELLEELVKAEESTGTTHILHLLHIYCTFIRHLFVFDSASSSHVVRHIDLMGGREGKWREELEDIDGKWR